MCSVSSVVNNQSFIVKRLIMYSQHTELQWDRERSKIKMHDVYIDLFVYMGVGGNIAHWRHSTFPWTSKLIACVMWHQVTWKVQICHNYWLQYLGKTEYFPTQRNPVLQIWSGEANIAVDWMFLGYLIRNIFC